MKIVPAEKRESAINRLSGVSGILDGGYRKYVGEEVYECPRYIGSNNNRWKIGLLKYIGLSEEQILSLWDDKIIAIYEIALSREGLVLMESYQLGNMQKYPNGCFVFSVRFF